LNSAGNATFANVSITSALNVGGVATFSAGSAAAPSITTTGDTNTGIFFPAADTIAFTEGGAESLRITSAGDVGIGTVSPSFKLDVRGSGNIISWSDGTTPGVLYSAASYFGLTNSTQTNGFFVNPSGAFCTIATNGSERARIDSSGNLGLGMAPSAWASNRSVIQLKGGTTAGGAYFVSGAATQALIGTNAYSDGTNFLYLTSNAASIYDQSGGAHSWLIAASGTAGNAISFTTAMALNASGNLGIGTTAPDEKLHVVSTADALGVRVSGSVPNIAVNLYNSGTGGRNWGVFSTNNGSGAGGGNLAIFDYTAGAYRAVFDSSGNLLVGITTASSHYIKKAVSVGTAVLEIIGNNVGAVFYNGDGGTPNAGNAVLKVWSVGATGRSINAAGTINASGADYAEYMTKASDFVIAKGDVCGIDANGKLTNVYADAISFVVKSTNPSYVGNDGWGGNYENDAEGLEAARQKVDRIAFAGQVPVNVLGATPGQYIVPINDNGAIKGVAVSNPTFEQYQAAVGKVIAVQDDGRARIIVKIA
jgi:hypothetical protein